MGRRCGAVSLFLAAVLWHGCAATRPPAPRPAPAELPSAEQIEQALEARRHALHSLRALARLHYSDPHETNTSREAVAVARPDRIRVEVLALFGSVFVLAADNGLMTAYARKEDTIYRGRASPENLERYARLGLPVSDLVDIVLGTPPARRGDAADVSFDTTNGWFCLRRQSGRQEQLVWLSETLLPTAAEERGHDGRTVWRATFRSYEDHKGVEVATRIGLELPKWSQSMQLTLEDIDVNPVLDGSVFAVQTPPGSTVVNLDRAVD